MAESLDVRRARFGEFVARVIRGALAGGMSIATIEAETGVSKSTIYRWRDGDWQRTPNPHQVRAFCDALGASVRGAYRILGLEESGEDKSDEELLLVSPALRTLARKLADPNVSIEEKRFIEENLIMLAARRSSKTTVRD